jgi:hypothetical protein
MEITVDPSRPKSVPLTQIQDLGDDRARRATRELKRCPGPIAESGITVAFVPSSPFVKGFARKAVMPADLSDTSRDLVGLPDDLEPPSNHSILFSLCHGALSG